MTWALTRTRTTALITVILAVFFFAQAQEARADTSATPNGVGVGKPVDGTPCRPRRWKGVITATRGGKSRGSQRRANNGVFLGR